MKRSFLSVASLLVLSSCFGVACGDGEPDQTPASGDGDGDPGDGDVGCDASQELCGDICASVNSDPANCGECGNACQAGEGCLDGECADFGCGTGQVVCSDQCVDLQTDAAHCGDCDEACDAGQVCDDGQCEASCPPEFLLCDGECVDPLKDRDFCGATSCEDGGDGAGGDGGGSGSSTVCEAGAVCFEGACTTSCPTDLLACGETCIDPLGDEAFCGATDCSAIGTSGEICSTGEECFAGTCTLNCPAGLLACDDTCVNPEKDADYCGATDCSSPGTSGVECASGEACFEGDCTLECPEGLLICGDTCVDPEKDADYCGATDCSSPGTSGVECASGEACFEGDCTLECPEGLLICGDTCVDPEKDADFCGATDCSSPGTSGEVCESGEACFEGDCTLECPEGLLICGDTCSNPLSDANFCGATDCSAPGTSGEACADGETCVIGECREFIRVWSQGAPISLPPNDTGTTDHALEVDQEGNAIAIWRQYTEDANTNLHLFARYFDASTKTWGDVVPLHEGGARPQNLRLAVAPTGEALALWIERVDDTNQTVWMARFTGTTWSQSVRIDNLSGPAETPTVALDGDGNAHLFWVQEVLGDALNVKRVIYSYLDSETQTLSTPAPIEGYGEGDCRPSQLPKVVANSAGWAALIFRDTQLTGQAPCFAGSNDWRVYGSVYDPESGTWSTPSERSNGAGYFPRQPDISIDAEGNAYGVWTGWNNVTSIVDMFVAKYVAGVSWAATEKLLDIGVNLYLPRIATSSDGLSSVAYLGDEGGGEHNVRVVQFDSALAISSNDTLQIDVPGSPSATTTASPVVGRTEDGETFVAWANGTSLDTARWDLAQGTWVGPVTLNQGLAGSATDPRIAISSAGQVYSTWYQNDGSIIAEYFARFD